jgi:RND superfamily putative drug exporter
MDQVNSIIDTARGAQPNTALADASVSMAGFPAANRDLRDYYNHDLRFVIAATIIVVLLILIVLLRALIAPVYLIFSVVISYMSALGIGVILFQFILGRELSWSVPGMAFIVLVAVGADYNMLLISGIRDESALHGIRAGVIRTVASTGGVITSAGVIFAASMFGLLFGSLWGLVQAGFIIGAGLLVDTFLVRTVTVPALAVIIGQANWWPILWGRPRPQSLLIEGAQSIPAPEDHDTTPESVAVRDRSVRAVWVNELGEVTFQVGITGVAESVAASTADRADGGHRLRQSARYASVPQVFGVDGNGVGGHPNGLPGVSAVHSQWLAKPDLVLATGDGRHSRQDRLAAAACPLVGSRADQAIFHM